MWIKCKKIKTGKYHNYGNNPLYLSKCFWKEHTFLLDGYFACSIEEASPEAIRRYIENQG